MTDPIEHRGAPLPSNEARRVAALREFEILDTAFESAYDGIVRLAAKLCDAPIALISLVDTERQWFKAEFGLGTRQTPREVSVCAHAILHGDFLEVPDTADDARFRLSPLVTGEPGMRFYAGAPLMTPDGLALGTVCVLDRKPRRLDESQRETLKALSDQAMALMMLRRSLVDASAMQKQLSRLMAVAGHDLRQPVQTMSMSLELLGRKVSGSDVSAIVERGLKAGRALGVELDALARASSIASQSFAPAREAIPLKEVLDEQRATWLPVAARKGLELRVVNTRLRVSSNRKMLDTILGNLIGNAIKYTEQGSVLVGPRRQGAMVRLDVLDTGIGIEPERMGEMFIPFRKADVQTAGLGLGLSIVRTTTELLGHELHLHSIPGQGTVVGIELPRA